MATIDRFQGLNNQQRPETLAPGTLRACSNVLVDDMARLETRFGYTLKASPSIGTVTDAFNMPHERYGFFLAGGSLYCWDGQAMRVAVSGINDERLHHAALGDHFVYAGHTAAGWVRDGVTYQPLRVPMPDKPTVDVITGVLPSGQYQITTVLRLYGGNQRIESPAHPSVSAWIADGQTGSISITPNPPVGWVADIYVTEADSTVERYVASSYGEPVIYNGQALLNALDDWRVNIQPLPSLPVSGLALFDLRLHVAFYNAEFNTTQFYRSIQGQWHLFRLNRDVYSRQGRCVQMLGVNEGVLVATDQEVFLWADDGTDAGRIQNLCRWGCSADRPMDKDSTGMVVINTDRGIATYPPFDVSSRLRFIPPKADSASVTIIHQDGKQLALIQADTSQDSYTAYGD